MMDTSDIPTADRRPKWPVIGGVLVVMLLIIIGILTVVI